MRACILSAIPLNNRCHHSDKTSTWALVKEEKKSKLEEEKNFSFFFSNFFPENLIISNCCDITPCLTYETLSFWTDTPTWSDTCACNPEPIQGYKNWDARPAEMTPKSDLCQQMWFYVQRRHKGENGKTLVLYNAAIGG